MTQQIIITTPENSGQGTPIATAFDYCNENFTELYSRAQTSPPPTFIGSPGDEPGFYASDSNYFYYCFANYDGVTNIWSAVAQAGNITATQIAFGSSNVDIASPNANVTISVNGYPNVITVAPRQVDVIGNIGLGGNIVAVGNVHSQLNSTANGYMRALGNVRGGNIRSDGYVSAVGNVEGSYFIGNGSLLTGINISSGNSISNGSSDVSIPDTDGNVNITIGSTPNLAVFSSGGLSVNGQITGTTLSGVLDTSAQTNITSLGTLLSLSVTGQIVTDGYISAAGNITGDYIYGNGAFLTGISSSGGNGTAIANGLSSVNIPVSSGNVSVTVGFNPNVAVFTDSGLAVVGNVTASSLLTNTVTASGTITAGNLLTSGRVSATGNITGNYFIGNGSQLTGIIAGTTYTNANVAAFLPTYTGNLSGNNISIANNANIDGNVNVDYRSTINGTVQGQLYGLLNGVNEIYGQWDFGEIVANTYTNPIQWIFAQTGVGNIDMGSITAPAAYNIDIGTIF